jgi:hypothetical protein
MAADNTIATLDGLHKIVYGDKLERIIPTFAKAQQAIPFKNRGKIGKRFEKPVAVGLEWGITNAAPEAGAFELVAPIAGQTKPAYVQAYQHVIRSRLAYDAQFQATQSGAMAFRNATECMYESMVESVRRRLECDILGYGQYGVAQVASKATHVITITDATWAPGMWVGAKGAPVCFYDAIAYSSDTVRTMTNSGGTASDSFDYIQSVDITNKAITIEDGTNVSVGDYIFFRTQRFGDTRRSMYGLRQIATTSGTLFGIANTTYDIFKGITYSAGSTDLSLDTILRSASEMGVRGVDGELLCWVSPRTYANVVSDLAALVRYDQSPGQKKYVIGAESVEMWTPMGKAKIEGHPVVMEGEAYLFQPKLLLRSGSTDVTFNRGSMGNSVKADGANFYRELPDNAGFEVRAYSGQFLFTHRPACVCLINNIVNS